FSIIDAGQHSRIFEVAPNNTVVLTWLWLQHGMDQTGAGGAILNQGNLTINTCVVVNNATMPGTPGATAPGGGVATLPGGSLNVFFSTIVGNLAQGNGTGTATGGNASGGGIFHEGNALTILNSTVQANRAVGGFADAAFSPSMNSQGGSAWGGGVFV